MSKEIKNEVVEEVVTMEENKENTEVTVIEEESKFKTVVKKCKKPLIGAGLLLGGLLAGVLIGKRSSSYDLDVYDLDEDFDDIVIESEN